MKFKLIKNVIFMSILAAAIPNSYADEIPDEFRKDKYSEYDKAKEVSLYQLNELNANNIRKIKKSDEMNKVNSLRGEAIKDMALRMGTSAGLAYQFKNVYEKKIASMSAELDRTYNFEKLSISPGALPPVLTQSFGNYEKKSDNLVMIADSTYSIDQKARMVSVYPTYRDYLQFHFKPSELPDSQFLPKTSAEKKLWDDYVKKGWEAGVEQAAFVWDNAFATLNRDYEGMILYKQLLANKQITPTVVASSNMGVTGNGSTMSVNQTMVTITDHSEFQRNSKKWSNSNPATFRDIKGRDY